MRFTSIELCNIGPYDRFYREFGQGLVGIVGPNGSGKSTILKSLYAAVTGDFSRFRGGRNAAIRLGAPDGAPAFIRLTGEHHGYEFELVRGLRKCARQTFHLAGETHTEAREVQQAMETLLGVPLTILEQYVFLRQGKLTELFELTDTARAKLFHNLCDTEVAETLWRVLGTRIGKMDKDLRVEAVPDPDARRVRIGALRRQEREAYQRWQQLSDRQLAKGRAQQYRDLVRKAQDCRGTRARAKSLLAELRHLKAERRPLLSRLAKLQLAREDLTDLLRQLQEESREAVGALQAWQAYDYWRAQVNEVRQRVQQHRECLEALREPRPPKRASPEGRSELVRELAELQTRKERAEQLADLLAAEHSTSCQACGAEVQTLVQMRDAARADLRELPRRIARLQEERAAVLRYERDLQRYRDDFAAEQGRLEAAQALLASLGTVEEPQLPKEQAVETVQRLKHLRELKGELDTEVADVSAQVSSRDTRAQRAAQDLQAAREALADLRVLTHQVGVSAEQAQEALQQHLESREALWYAKQTVTSLRSQIDLERHRLREEQALVDRRQTAVACVSFLERLREVFHRDNLPRRLAAQKLRKLEGKINETLADFGNPFRVETQADLSFLCHFPGRGSRPDTLLSGGQQTILAMAMLRAVNLLYASRVGLLVLDEPSEALDRDNVAYLRTALERFGHEADRRGAQVFLVTHQDSLTSAFTSTVCLGDASA